VDCLSANRTANGPAERPQKSLRTSKLAMPSESNRPIDELRRQHEQILERGVLGDGYDSAVGGKSKEPKPWIDRIVHEGPVFTADGRQIWPPNWLEYLDHP
jgi:ribosome modulation factor